jgi:hypothetical protein
MGKEVIQKKSFDNKIQNIGLNFYRWLLNITIMSLTFAINVSHFQIYGRGFKYVNKY